MTPEISVIIPTHNRKSLVDRAIRSVLSQTLSSFELRVVDDGSCDGTGGLSYGDERVRFLFQPRRGVAAARNLGIRDAQAPWIAFLDSDDEWHPEKLAAQLAYHRRHPACRISQTEEIWIRNGRRIFPKRRHKKPSGMIFVPALALCLISPSSVMVHREVFDRVGLFDESFPVCEDYELWLRVTLFFPVGLIEQALTVKYGGHADQLSSAPGLDRYRVLAIEKILNSYPLSAGEREAALRHMAAKAEVYAQGCLKRGREDEARHFLALGERYRETPNALLQT